MKRSIWSFCIAGFFLNLLNFSCFASEDIKLESLIQEALSRNPDIKIFQKKSDALWQRPSQAKAWDDPRLTFGFTNLPVDDFDFDKQDMTQKTVSVMQNIPFPGIQSLKGEIAEEVAKSADMELELQRTVIIKKVKTAYFKLYYINSSIEIIRNNEDILDNFIELTRTKYEVGKGLQSDILRAEVELSKLREKLINFIQQQTAVKAEINMLLNRNSSDILMGKPAKRENTKFNYTANELKSMALEANPLLKAIDHVIKRSEADYHLAKKMYFPEFTVTASYGQRDRRQRSKSFPARVTNSSDGTFSNVVVSPLSDDRNRPDFFSFLIGINIPIWFKTKQDRRVSETFFLINQAEAQYESIKNNLFFKIDDTTSRIIRGRDLIELYSQRIIPQAEQSLNADMSAYQVAEVDSLTLLSSQITLFNYQIEYQRTVRDYEKDMAELEAEVGKRIF